MERNVNLGSRLGADIGPPTDISSKFPNGFEEEN